MKTLRKYSITAQLLSLIFATTSVVAAETQYHLGIKSHASDATFAESAPSFTPFFRLTSHSEVVGGNLTADPLFSKSSSEWNFSQGGISLNRGPAIIKHGKFAINWGFSPKSSLFMSENAVPFMATHAELSFESLNTRSFLDSGKFQFFSGTLTGNSLPANTQITGMRYSVKPLPYLSLEGLRVTQWGGEGFLNGWSVFKHAMFGNSNEGDHRNVNHVAGYGVSITVPSRLGKTQLYSQHMGEDEADMIAAGDHGFTTKEFTYGMTNGTPVNSWDANNGDRVHVFADLETIATVTSPRQNVISNATKVAGVMTLATPAVVSPTSTTFNAGFQLTGQGQLFFNGEAGSACDPATTGAKACITAMRNYGVGFRVTVD